MTLGEFPKDKIEQLFYENYGNLDEEAILDINDKNPGGDINNVVVGLTTHCYGIWLMEDLKEVNYQLFYINGQNKLEGDFLQLSLDIKHRDYLVFYFSSFLAHNYDGLDPIDIFNTFQSQTRSLLEKIDYVTIDGTTIDKYENPTFFALGKRGIIRINFLDRLTIYRELFSKPKLGIDSTVSSDYVYLMLNKRNNYIKIGKSKNPLFREKTLQSDEPDIELVVAWQASSVVEKELHKLFPKKRKRGEWFELKLSDMKIIRDHMKEYK
jgi:hypothetical protein